MHRVARKELKTKDFIINIPPRSLKSTITSVCLNAWAWIHYPYMNFINGSYSLDIAIDLTIKTRQIIMSDFYQQNWGNVFKLSDDQNTKSKFANDKGGERRSASTGGTVTGAGADFILIDDPHSARQADSETERNTAIDWYNKSIYTRLNNPEIGFRCVIMQRLHEEDLTGYLLENSPDKYLHICIPAENVGNVSPPELASFYVDNLFSPIRFNRNVLDDMRHALGSAAYSGQYLQQAYPSDGLMIKRDWFKLFTQSELPPDLAVNFYSDTAYGNNEQSDYSATLAWVYHQGNIYVTALLNVNLPFPEFLKSYKQFIQNSGYSNKSRCYIEPKASGLSIIQQLKLERLQNGQFINVIADKPPTESKISRVSAITNVLESGRVYLLNNPWADNIIDQCIAFPNGKHDDIVDALIGAIRISISNPNIIIMTA